MLMVRKHYFCALIGLQFKMTYENDRILNFLITFGLSETDITGRLP